MFTPPVLPASLLFSLGLALLISALGFRQVVYFISIGYAFSITAMAVALPIYYFPNLSWISVLQCTLLALWGLRLGIFLVQREAQPSYKRELVGVAERTYHRLAQDCNLGRGRRAVCGDVFASHLYARTAA